jgi:hypothetical protein
MVKGLTKNLAPAAGLVGGAVAAGFVTKVVPIGNDKIKAAAPILVGLLLMGKKGILGSLGAGMVAGGGLKLAQSFGIGATEDPIMALDVEEEINGFESPIQGHDGDFEETELD